ncbi:5-formyltetrahydrofolate cyclo-ligase [Parasphingorhabdus sp.]|uniref:5-formyltetrahydrofolate cyclo-ligase n=1 Tax=Parasphingorhabdus sp. TaxID=2709688 RepID=UPI003262E468
MSDLVENKKNLREEYRRRRDAFVSQLDTATRTLAFRRPPTPLNQLFEQTEVIALYQAVGSEAPTMRLMEYLSEIGKTVAFPVVTGQAPLEFRAVSDIELLEAGYQNIPEPSESCPVVTPDLIIAPLIAFDRRLGRLGQGQGHYDRTFEKYTHAKRIGLAWSVQELDSIPIEEHDVPLDMIITEYEIIQSVNMTS